MAIFSPVLHSHSYLEENLSLFTLQLKFCYVLLGSVGLFSSIHLYSYERLALLLVQEWLICSTESAFLLGLCFYLKEKKKGYQKETSQVKDQISW